MDQQEQTLITESISTFLSASRDQELKALGVHQALLIMLNRLNATFNGLPDLPIVGPALPPLLLSQAHSAFLAAVRMSLGGQVHVAYMALRACIESALYALIMKQQASSQKAWINRKTDRALCRKIFTASSGLALLKEIDSPLKQVIEEAYEATIDRGAHPNPLSLGSHLDFDEWDAANKISNILLLPEDDTAVENALHCCIVVGAAVASLCAYVMPDHGPAAAARDEAMEVIGVYMTELGHGLAS